MQSQKDVVVDTRSSEEVLDHCIGSLSQSLEIGQHATLQLQNQGETLRRAEGKLDDVHQYMDASERIIKKMSSPWYARMWMAIKGNHYSLPEKKTKNSHKSANKNEDKKQNSHGRKSREDEQLQTVNKLLDDLLVQGQDIQKELELQNRSLDHMTEKTDQASNKVVRATRNLSSI